MFNIVNKARTTLGKFKAACAVLMLSLFATGNAMAAGSGVDTSSITAVFDQYKAEAVVLFIAFIVVLWTLKATGLLKPRS